MIKMTTEEFKDLLNEIIGYIYEDLKDNLQKCVSEAVDNIDVFANKRE